MASAGVAFSASQLRRRGSGPNLESACYCRGAQTFGRECLDPSRGLIFPKLPSKQGSNFVQSQSLNRPSGGQFLSSDTCRLRVDGQSWPWLGFSSADLCCEQGASEDGREAHRSSSHQNRGHQQHHSPHLAVLTCSHPVILLEQRRGLILRNLCYRHKTVHTQRVPPRTEVFCLQETTSSASIADHTWIITFNTHSRV